jgi:MoaA/NifB/PqqE/SkfB family radical SAM enzyme
MPEPPGAAGADAVVQIHPSRSCNLTCLHCYSASGPQYRGGLSLGLLGRALADAHDQGYTRVSVSGGEPLMYPPLRELLVVARSIGMSTSVTTNGTLLDEKNTEWLRELADVVAVSVDGVPASHNRIRGWEHAFEHTERGLGQLQRAGVAFAVIFVLTEHNFDELPWVMELTARYGGRAVQVHPLEAAGRAIAELPNEIPDAMELAQGWSARLRVGAAAATADANRPMSGPALHADIADIRMLLRHPELVIGPAVATREHRLADLVRPLVIEDDGSVVPLTYGFSRQFQIGTITDERLSRCARDWMQVRYVDFRAQCAAALQRLQEGPPRFPFVNWYEYVAAVAARASEPEASLPLTSAAVAP